MTIAITMSTKPPMSIGRRVPDESLATLPHLRALPLFWVMVASFIAARFHFYLLLNVYFIYLFTG